MKKRDCRALSSGQARRLSYRRARNDTAPPSQAPPFQSFGKGTRPRQGGGCKQGYTLIEVILAIVVVTIAVSATLVIMSKMMGYTVNRGQAVDISNAIAISQIAVDKVRDQKFPPTDEYGDLTDSNNSGDLTISGINYTYETEIIDFNVTNPTNEYGSATGDVISDSRRNLLKVTVTVFKNGRPILKTMTYKTRNGYY